MFDSDYNERENGKKEEAEIRKGRKWEKRGKENINT